MGGHLKGGHGNWKTHHGRTQQLKDRPWKDTAIAGPIMGDYRTQHGRTQELQDTSWEDTVSCTLQE